MTGGTHIQISVRISWAMIGVLLIALSVPVDGRAGTALAIVGAIAVVVAGYRRHRAARVAKAGRRGKAVR